MQKIDLQEIQQRLDSQKQIASSTKPSTEVFSEHDQKLVNWFFAMIRTAWGQAKFNSQFGDEEDMRFTKRYWAKRIVKHDQRDLQEMLDMADKERLNGNDKFAWPDIAAILSLQSTRWERQAHNRPIGPAALEDLSAKERRRQQGLIELQKLRESVGL